MSVAAPRIVSQPLQPVGFQHIQNVVGAQIGNSDVRARARLSNEHCLISTVGTHAQTQKLIIRKSSWAEQNLEMTLASTGAPTSEEVEAARAAVSRIAGRVNEDVEAWAVRLGEKFGSYID